jgi:hypothetical protein
MKVVWGLFISFICCSAMNPLEVRLVDELRFWQKRLGMDDWTMSLQVVRQSELDPKACGRSHWNARAKTATIQVLDPRDYSLKGNDLRLDMECTIVHELVHIQVSPLVSRLDTPDVQVREDVVNKLMGALLNRPCPN